MKRNILFIFSLLFAVCTCNFAIEPFRFALFTDLHLSPSNAQPAEDLLTIVNEVNTLSGIDFVIVSGDISESGDGESLRKAKSILDQLHIPYYIVPGNHELKWSESGATDFARIFGNDKFSFQHNGCLFIGFTTGPIIKMADGHIAPQDIDWVKSELTKRGSKIPVFGVTHYPLQTGDVDNWFDMTDVLRNFNVQAVLGGHYHRNVFFNYDGIPGIIHRSCLRGKDSVGGYSILSVSDSIRVFEKKVGQAEHKWLTISFEPRQFDAPDQNLRPSYAVNKQYKNVKEIWHIDTRVGLYCKPAVNGKQVFYGDDLGNMNCVSLSKGAEYWKFKTASRIISSPAVTKDKVVFGSTDGNIYCLATSDGKLIWKVDTHKAVMGCPLIQGDTVFIGGSDGTFLALSLSKGAEYWKFDGLKNYVETCPIIANGKIYFGAWDTNFYALNKTDGALVWKWNNGQARVHFSPAAVVPVFSHGKIFITAPDRYWTALNAETGKEVWRTNQHTVRETIGVSEDGNTVFSRCMNDSVVALDASTDTPKVRWKTNAAYGYDHNPSMLEERNGVIVFGTKSGLLHGIDAKTGNVLWRYKIGNTIINTVTIISKNECVLTTNGGVVARIKY